MMVLNQGNRLHSVSEPAAAAAPGACVAVLHELTPGGCRHDRCDRPLNLLLYTAGIRVNWQVMPHRDDKICAVLATAELLLYLTGSPAAGMPLILSAQQSLSDTSCNNYRHLYLIVQSRAVNLGRRTC